MQVHVAKAELWSMPVDAVVNPANSLGIMGGGIGGTLRRQGGDVIQQAAMAASPIARLGIRTINCSPVSTLKNFPIMAFEEALAA